MLTRIDNSPVNYAWGSKTLLVDLGFEATGAPLAEVWFGTHPVSESIAQPSGKPLSQHLGRNLNFMMKFLAAESPLSIQVHPNEAQAILGFESENRAGLDLADSTRNFKDASAKREAIVAVSPFDLLAGLKTIEEIRVIFSKLTSHVSGEGALELARYADVASNAKDASDVLREVLDADPSTQGQRVLLEQLRAELPKLDWAIFDVQLLTSLFENFGLDRGILVALMMHRFNLEPGQAVYVNAGVPHSYLSGLGVEILNSSDNVLRGGLTSKHVAPSDFLSVLDVQESALVQPLDGVQISQGLWSYYLADVDFALHRISVTGQNMLVDFKLAGESILVCTAGELAISNSLGEQLKIRKGQAAYLSAEANFFTIAGSGDGLIGSASS